jgi:hypothetical protein
VPRRARGQASDVASAYTASHALLLSHSVPQADSHHASVVRPAQPCGRQVGKVIRLERARARRGQQGGNSPARDKRSHR